MKNFLIATTFISSLISAQLADAETGSITQTQLQDGTTIEIVDDSVVNIIDKDGSKTPAPDGKYILSDGAGIEIIDGKIANRANNDVITYQSNPSKDNIEVEAEEEKK